MRKVDVFYSDNNEEHCPICGYLCDSLRFVKGDDICEHLLKVERLGGFCYLWFFDGSKI